MKQHILRLSVWFFLVAIPGFGQTLEKWFPKEDLMKVGVYYYPEQWPKNQWSRDLQNMAKQGFQFTHFGEFAWAFMEPEEGKYEFGWLDDALDLAGKNGLKVVLCTPSAAPPVWLTEKYPETLIQDADGTLQRHGARTHCSWSSPKYRELVEKMVNELGKRYGQDKRVWGWQIDNEPTHYGVEYDFSPAVALRYQEWLKKKYGSIEKLNEAWGTAFWSERYQKFEQIRLPNPKELPQMPNPHSSLDFRRFQAEECAGFVSFQAEILRKHIAKTQWITTNYMAVHTQNNPFLSKDLDFLTFTAYPAAGFALGHGNEGFRVNLPSTLGQPLDYFRSVKGITGIMELQPGQVNWGRYNPQVYPGAVRLWLYQALGAGAGLTCSYRYRQPLTGSEQYHYGMVGTDGVTPTSGGLEYQQTIKEIAALKKLVVPAKDLPERLKSLRSAILYSRDNTWDMNIQRQTSQWNPLLHVTKYYEALRAMQAPVDFVDDEADFSKYPFLVVPAYQLVDEKLADKLARYAEKGGHLVLSCRFAQKDKNGKFPETPYQPLMKKLAGAQVKFFDLLPDDRFGKVAFGGKNYEWNNWGEILEPESGTTILATYIDQFYKNAPAATKRKLGKGSVTYIGVETDAFRLERELLRDLYQTHIGRPVTELKDGLEVLYRDGLWFGLNFHTSENRTVPIPENAKIVQGQAELKPCDVVVWTEK